MSLKVVEKMKLTGNQIMYLLTIKKLAGNRHVVKSVDVARDLNYSRASVHKMLKSLKDLNYIQQEHYGSIRLTSSGSRAATSYLKKYQVIEDVLKDRFDLPEGYQLGICNLIELL